jgi:hypothetical protein
MLGQMAQSIQRPEGRDCGPLQTVAGPQSALLDVCNFKTQVYLESGNYSVQTGTRKPLGKIVFASPQAASSIS